MAATPSSFGPRADPRVTQSRELLNPSESRASGQTATSSAIRRSRTPDTLGIMGPSISFAENNAMLSIHENTAWQVRRHYVAAGATELRFQCVEGSISESSNPQYDAIAVPGRSEAYMAYKGTENRKIRMKLAFCASLVQEDRAAKDMAMRAVRWLQSLCYPTYTDSSGLMYPPAVLALVFGRWISARVVLTDCAVTWEDTYLFDENGVLAYPMIGRAQLEFTCVNRRPRQASDFLAPAGESLPPM